MPSPSRPLALPPCSPGSLPRWCLRTAHRPPPARTPPRRPPPPHCAPRTGRSTSRHTCPAHAPRQGTYRYAYGPLLDARCSALTTYVHTHVTVSASPGRIQSHTPPRTCHMSARPLSTSGCPGGGACSGSTCSCTAASSCCGPQRARTSYHTAALSGAGCRRGRKRTRTWARACGGQVDLCTRSRTHVQIWNTHSTHNTRCAPYSSIMRSTRTRGQGRSREVCARPHAHMLNAAATLLESVEGRGGPCVGLRNVHLCCGWRARQRQHEPEGELQLLRLELRRSSVSIIEVAIGFGRGTGGRRTAACRCRALCRCCWFLCRRRRGTGRPRVQDLTKL